MEQSELAKLKDEATEVDSLIRDPRFNKYFNVHFAELRQRYIKAISSSDIDVEKLRQINGAMMALREIQSWFDEPMERYKRALKKHGRK